MSSAIPDLWPDDISITDVLSPLAIMRHQAGQLRKKTNNVLEAEIKSSSSDEKVTHSFIVIAPALDRYKYELFFTQHKEAMVYPVAVFAECFESYSYEGLDASSQAQFIELVRKVLNSDDAMSVIQSLIAQSNDAKTSSDS